MAIDRISSNNPIQPANHANKASKASHVERPSDRVEISEAGRAEASHLRQMEIIKSAPDIREEKVAMAKANLEKYMAADGGLDDAVANALYDKIIHSLLD